MLIVTGASGRAGFLRRAAAGHDDVGAGFGQRNRDGLADARVGAGDQRGFSCEIEQHGIPHWAAEIGHVLPV